MNKKYIIALGCIALVLVVFYFIYKQDSPIKNYPPKNDVIVAFGDSLVEGVGSTRGNDFVSLLSKKLAKPILNYGISGNTTRDGLARISNIAELDPGIVILLLGGNDYLKKIPEKETFDNLNKIISILQSNGAVVVLLGVRGGLLTDRFKESFEDLAKTTGVVYVPNVLDGLFGNQKFMSDAIHPNDLGYKKIADKIYSEMKSL